MSNEMVNELPQQMCPISSTYTQPHKPHKLHELYELYKPNEL
jgi:hypothetical protein